MVAWVVINRQHLPRAARGPANPASPASSAPCPLRPVSSTIQCSDLQTIPSSRPLPFPFWNSPHPHPTENHRRLFMHLRGTHPATPLFSYSCMYCVLHESVCVLCF